MAESNLSQKDEKSRWKLTKKDAKRKWFNGEEEVYLVGGSRLNLPALKLVAQVKAVRFAVRDCGNFEIIAAKSFLNFFSLILDCRFKQPSTTRMWLWRKSSMIIAMNQQHVVFWSVLIGLRIGLLTCYSDPGCQYRDHCCMWTEMIVLQYHQMISLNDIRCYHKRKE